MESKKETKHESVDVPRTYTLEYVKSPRSISQENSISEKRSIDLSSKIMSQIWKEQNQKRKYVRVAWQVQSELY